MRRRGGPLPLPPSAVPPVAWPSRLLCLSFGRSFALSRVLACASLGCVLSVRSARSLSRSSLCAPPVSASGAYRWGKPQHRKTERGSERVGKGRKRSETANFYKNICIFQTYIVPLQAVWRHGACPLSLHFPSTPSPLCQKTTCF